MSRGVTAHVYRLVNAFSDWRDCVMFQGTAGRETQETRTEDKSPENHQNHDGEVFLDIFHWNLLHGRNHVFFVFFFTPFVSLSSFITAVCFFCLFVFFSETNKSVRTVASVVEEHDMPEGETKAGAAAASEGSSSASLGQDVPKETTTTSSSPDTDSPVMINVDVSSISLGKHMLRIFLFM